MANVQRQLGVALSSRDTVDNASSALVSKLRSSSVPVEQREGDGSVFAMPRPPLGKNEPSLNAKPPSTGSTLRRNPSLRGSSSGQNAAGAVDEESFVQAFHDVKRVNVGSSKVLNDEFTKIKDTLSKSSNDWKVRVDALQRVRSLMIAGAADFEEMSMALKYLEVPFQVSLKDLRSQVVREACITTAFMSEQLGQRAGRFLEVQIQPVINLIQSSAKVMATSGIVCMRFIMKNTYNPRFLPILTSNIASKSRELRRFSLEFLDQLLRQWPTHCIDKHMAIVREAIRKGVADADPDARQLARKAFWGFSEHFKNEGDQLLQSLDANQRRMLQSNGSASSHVGGDVSNSSSNTSLHHLSNNNTTANNYKRNNAATRSRQHSVNNSQENLSENISSGNHGNRRPQPAKKNPTSMHASGIPAYSTPPKNIFSGILAQPLTPGPLSRSVSSNLAAVNEDQNNVTNGIPLVMRSKSGILESHRRPSRIPRGVASLTTPTPPPPTTTPMTSSGFTPRSNSAIDASAVRRAKVRSQYAMRNRMNIATNALTLTRRKSSLENSPAANSNTSSNSERMGRSPFTSNQQGQYYGSSKVHSQPGSRSTSPTSLRSYHTYYQQDHNTPNTLGRRRSGGLPVRSNALTSREASPNRFNRSLNQPTSHRSPTTPRLPPNSQRTLKQSTETEKAVADALRDVPIRRRNGAFDDNSDESETSSISSAGVSGQQPQMKNRSSNSRAPPTVGRFGGQGGADQLDNSIQDERVRQSLQSTANAIQKYSFDGQRHRSPSNNLDSSTASLEEKMTLLGLGDNNNIHTAQDAEALEYVQNLLRELECSKQSSNCHEVRKKCLTQLIRFTRDQAMHDALEESFRLILGHLLDILADDQDNSSGASRALVFGAITEMFHQQHLAACFQAFTELVILKVLDAHKDNEKDVERAAEGCASAMAEVLPAETVVRVLNPVIRTGDFPVNQAAIKMLTRVAEHSEAKETMIHNLDKLMPGLLKAYDNVESSVRKASVFCMVALHQLVGEEELQPHLEVLSGSKLKLVNLYIKRAQERQHQQQRMNL